MGLAPGDKATYRNRRAIVCTVHDDGALNVVFGTDYSGVSDGFWPPEPHERVDPDEVEPGWPDEDGDEEDVSTATTGATEASTTSTTETEEVETSTTADDPDTIDEDESEAEPEDEGEGGEWESDFDADAFVDRTPMSEVVDDIRTGEYDDVLDAIEAAEEAGRDRVGVADAIEARREG